MEFLIGRGVTGENTIIVPQEYNYVSRVHAKITIDEDGIFIQDLNSTYGTYVNDEQIIIKFVSANDKVSLGKVNEYLVAINEIIEKYNTAVNENKTDYSKEFDELEKVYEEYLKKENRIKFKSRIKPMIISVVLMIIIYQIFPILYKVKSLASFLPESNEIIRISITFIPIIITFISNISSEDTKLMKKLNKVKIEYKNKYICPKCRKKLMLNTPWEILKSEEVCPNKCGAIYSK